MSNYDELNDLPRIVKTFGCLYPIILYVNNPGYRVNVKKRKTHVMVYDRRLYYESF